MLAVLFVEGTPRVATTTTEVFKWRSPIMDVRANCGILRGRNCQRATTATARPTPLPWKHEGAATSLALGGSQKWESLNSTP